MLGVERLFALCAVIAGFAVRWLRTPLILASLALAMATAAEAQVATTTTLTTDPESSVEGQDVVLTATVTSGSGTPTGTVTFIVDGAGAAFPQALVNGTTSLTIPWLTLGDHEIYVEYHSDNPSNFNDSNSDIVDFTVTAGAAATTTSLSVSPTMSVFGEDLTMTATVTVPPPGSGTPTGLVQFYDGAVFLGTAPLSGSTAVLTEPAVGTGSRTITAVFVPTDADFTGSTSPTQSITVNQASTTASVSGSPSPAVFGEQVTLTATVAALAPGAGTPTGTVSFFDGATLLGTGVLSAGVATYDATSLSVGSHMITAVYGGDSNFVGATSPMSDVTVSQGQSSAALVASPNPSVFGEQVMLTATISPVAPSTAVPTGTVQFFDGSTSLGTATLSGGVATLPTSSLTVGSHNAIAAVYSGDSGYAGSTSPNIPVTVNQANTNTDLTITPATSVSGQVVTLAAAITAVAPSSGMPTGSVTFSDGAGFLVTVPVNASGMATTTSTTLETGVITATYNGAAGFTGSSDQASVTVNKGATTIATVISPNPSVVGQTVTLTATVTAVAPAVGTPTGLVAFSGPGGFAAAATIDPSGVATTTITASQLGTITATYGGDAAFTASTNGAAIVVNQGATTTTLTATPNPSTAGQMVTLTATVAPVAPAAGTPTGTVTFTGPGGFSEERTPDGAGIATVSSSSLQTGTYTATYNGDASFAGSSDSEAVVVNVFGNIIIRQETDRDDATFGFTSSESALNVSIPTSGGSGESAPIALAAGTYTVTAADMGPEGYALTSLVCDDGDSTGDVATRTATIRLAAAETVICTFSSVNAAERTTDLVSDFFETRAGLVLSNQPDAQRRVDRLNGVVTSVGSPVTQLMNYASGEGETGRTTVSASLNAVNKLSGDVEPSAFDVWVEGTYVGVDASGAAGDSDGDFAMATIGADYVVNRNLLVGGFLQVDRLSQSFDLDDASIDGTGWLAGPYATLRLTENLFLDVLAGAGQSTNTVSPYGTYEDDFDATRWLVSASLQGQWTRDAWTFSPRGRVSYFEESSDSYVDSLGVDIPSVTVGLGQIAAGPGVSYRYETDNSVAVDTGLRLEGIVDILDNAEESGFDNPHGRVEGSVDVRTPAGMAVGFSAAYDGIGSDDRTATSGKVRVSVPLN